MSKKQAVKEISLLLISSLLGAGCVFLTQVILARQLGPSDFGLFAAALAMITLLAPLAGFGIAGYWLKAFGQEGWHATRWLPGSFKFTTLSTLIVVLLLVGWAILGPHDALTTTVLLVLTFYVFGQLVVELVSGKLQLEQQYLHLALWQFLPHLARLFLIVVLAYATTLILNVEIVAYAYAVVALVIFIVGFVLLLRMYQGKFFLKGHSAAEGLEKQNKQDSPGMFQVAVQSWPFGLAGIFYLIYFQSDIIFLKYISGSETAGVYNVAFLVMAVVYLLPNVVYQKFMLPKLHRWAHHDRERFYHTYRVGNVIMVALGIVAMLGIWVVVPWAIPVLFGAEYQGAILLLTILSFAAPIRFLATSVGATLVTQDHMQRKVKYMGAVATLNIILNLALIPAFGAVGAAVATVSSELALLIIYIVSVKANVFKYAEMMASGR